MRVTGLGNPNDRAFDRLTWGFDAQPGTAIGLVTMGLMAANGLWPDGLEAPGLVAGFAF